jgi:hypothetical protein
VSHSLVGIDRQTPDSADVSESRVRILMQKPASPFVIRNAVIDTSDHWYPSSAWARSMLLWLSRARTIR